MNKAELEEAMRAGGALMSTGEREAPALDPIEVHDAIGAIVGHYTQSLRVMDHRVRTQQFTIRKLEKQLDQSEEARRVLSAELDVAVARVALLESTWTPPKPNVT